MYGHLGQTLFSALCGSPQIKMPSTSSTSTFTIIFHGDSVLLDSGDLLWLLDDTREIRVPPGILSLINTRI